MSLRRCMGGACLMILAISTLGGCQFAAVALDALPPPAIPAAYEPIDQRTIVLVDDPRRLIPSIQTIGFVSHGAGQILKDEEIISEFVPNNAVDDLRLNDPDFANWPIDRIGRHLGASQVIYVLVEQFYLRDSDGVYRPAAVMRIKMVDAETGKRLFPTDNPDGYPVVSRLRFKGEATNGTAGMESMLMRQLAERMAQDVAHVFYKHPQPPSGLLVNQ